MVKTQVCVTRPQCVKLTLSIQPSLTICLIISWMLQRNIPDIPRMKTVLVRTEMSEQKESIWSAWVKAGRVPFRGLHNPHSTVTSLHSVRSLGGKRLNVTIYDNRNARWTFTFCQACLENDLDTVTSSKLKKIWTHSSFTKWCAFIRTLIKIYIKIRWLLHVSVYDHHQGACNWAWLKLCWY